MGLDELSRNRSVQRRSVLTDDIIEHLEKNFDKKWSEINDKPLGRREKVNKVAWGRGRQEKER